MWRGRNWGTGTLNVYFLHSAFSVAQDQEIIIPFLPWWALEPGFQFQLCHTLVAGDNASSLTLGLSFSECEMERAVLEGTAIRIESVPDTGPGGAQEMLSSASDRGYQFCILSSTNWNNGKTFWSIRILRTSHTNWLLCQIIRGCCRHYDGLENGLSMLRNGEHIDLFENNW